MSNQKKYWKGIEELKQDPSFVENSNKEFSEYLPVNEFLGDEKNVSSGQTSRRDFLKYLGFSVTAASLAACETPITKAIPYVVKPEEVNPGIANWYASSYFDGNDFASILVKTREGRPILIEGNKKSGITKGRVNARINSSVLSLYDSNRQQYPMMNGEKSSWDAVDKEIKSKLGAAANGGSVRMVTPTIISPSTKAIINEISSSMNGGAESNGEESASGSGSFAHVMTDVISYTGMLKANEQCFGMYSMPVFRFDKAKVIVGVDADFLGNWIAGFNFAGDYTSARRPENGDMSRHYQFETNMSTTGASADKRITMKPSEHGSVVKDLYNAVAKKVGQPGVSAGNSGKEGIEAIAADLLKNKGNSLVVSGSNDSNIQVLVNGINYMLENYGGTLNMDVQSTLKQGNDDAYENLIKEMESGKVDVLFIQGLDPVYTSVDPERFKAALAKVKTTVSFSVMPDMTSELCTFHCPDNHGLESWNDANPSTGYYSLAQPCISNIYDTRQFQDSLLTWMGKDVSYYDYIRTYWKENIFTKQTASVLFEDFWNSSLHDGIFEMKAAPVEWAYNGDAQAAASKIKAETGAFEVLLYQKAGIGDGSQFNNPWLQELPDPISKVTWDNYVTMSISDAESFGFNALMGQEQKSNMVTVTMNGMTTEALPVLVQPGQAKGTIGIALGYGKKAWKMNEKVGVNVFPLVHLHNDHVDYSGVVDITPVDETYHLAATQTHQTVMGRGEVIKETDFGTFKNGNKNDYNAPLMLATHDGKTPVKEINLWNDHEVEGVGHRWGLSIDLNDCIGCGACITACSAENNVPVVGKDEVRRGREMHWLRIDRYYSSDSGHDEGYTLMEIPSDEPEVVFQPMMCQHCNHAPCETVCPVAATTHSNEGLNQMTYNRCIGTRYCANNCPYKVRRFNWFNYIGNDKFADMNPMQDDLGRMVLNPDVTVRARGVMEKCSMCVQRIQAGKLVAKKEGRKVKDGDISTACSAACPTNSIVFGDLNDENSMVAKNANKDRAYQVIESVGTRPNVYYQTKVRNKQTNEA